VAVEVAVEISKKMVRISKKNWLAVEKKFGILVVRVGSCAGHDLLGGESR
jgi:hypothetical protein